ncbi:MAG: sigma 54-interacting transcriptional regulator [Deltaproteobacteria bacterium]|nr:sigma 54-interacting transcriptional regulator [Deltaproteobacteria bacterium]
MIPTELSQSEWLNIVDFLRNGFVAVDSQGNIKSLNETAARIIGTDIAHAVGSRVDDLVPTMGLLEVMTSGRDEMNQSMTINGHKVFVNRMAIRRGDQVVGAIGVFQDASELEELSQELESVKAVNQQLDGIFELVADGLVLADEKGVILRVNKAYKSLVGILDEEYVGKNVHQLLKEGYIGRSVSDTVINRRASYTIVDVRNGRELLLTGNPIFNDRGEIIRVVTVVRDATELSDLQRRLAESEAARNTYYEELQKLHAQLPYKKIIANGPALKQIVELALHVAQVDSSVLILGESGVGKDLFARLIHRASKRALKPYIDINCGAIPGNLLESEFFGYEAGAFTGALKHGKAGLFELAHGGTLFLDEVGDLPMDLQVKVLKAIQSKQITRVGGTKTIDLDVRIIAATNRELEQMVREKTFRQDLFYRLNVVPITLPPLRERREDIIPLVTEFLLKFNSRYGYQKWIHQDVMNCLVGYDWPGNVRELENTIERLVVTCRDDCINLDSLHGFSHNFALSSCASLSLLKVSREQEERQLVLDAYRQGGSTRKASEILGISQSSVVKKMKKYGIPGGHPK